jgi:hypothetical protein
METNATSVDGEWYSERRLPELTKYGGGSLSNAKYFQPGGLLALRAMLEHANRYGLKWVFVRDPYYDPLLEFAGFRQVDELDNGAITIWSRDVQPATPVFGPAQMPPHWQGIMWGTLPFGSSILAILVVLFIPDRRRREHYDDGLSITPMPDENLVPGRMVS